jgi:hypothetical protein
MKRPLNRIAILTAGLALVATSGLGAWAAQAATDDGQPTTIHVSSRHGEPEPGDDHGHHHGDDHGDHQGRHHGETEPGDDHGDHHGDHEPGDDHGHHHGDDD